MANPTWFDAAHYKAQKLTQLQATDSNGAWTPTKLDTVLAANGFAGAEGAFAHFTAYGSDEHCTPNAAFNASEYLAAKLVQLQKMDSLWAGKSLNDVQAALAAAGLGEWEHYQLYGSKEGVNPSNAFDESAYYDAKLAQLIETDATNWTGKSAIDVRTALQNAGLSALEHFLMFGKAEGLTAPAVPAEEQVAVPSTFYIFGGQGGMPSVGLELTRGTDNLTGTAGNDSFFAADASGFPTLNATDTLTGGAGEDTLYIGSGAGSANFAAASIKGIETVVAVEGSIDVSSNADVKSVTTIGSGSINATLAQKVSLENYILTDNHEVKFVDATGKDDAVTLNLKANDMNGLTVAGIEKLTLNVTGKNANYGTGNDPDASIDFINGAVEELIVTGEGSVMLAGTVGSTGTVSNLDFSANKGGVDVTMSSANFAKVASVKGGAGNDSVTYNNGTTNTEKMLLTVDMGAGDDTFEVVGKVHKDAKFDGGEGSDTLVLNSIATATMTKTFGEHFTNFESVTLEGSTTYVNTYFKGISDATVIADGSNTVSITDLGTVTVTDGGNSTTTITSLALASKAADVTFDNHQTGRAPENGVTITTLSLTGTTDLALHSDGNTTGAENKINALTAAANALEKITIDGDQDFTVTTLTGGSSLKEIDASALTGDLSLGLGTSKAGIVVKAGAGDDKITTAATSLGAKLTGGEGDDTFDVSATTAGATPGSSTALLTNAIVFTDFVKGDSIKLNVSANTFADGSLATGSDILAKTQALVAVTTATVSWLANSTGVFIISNAGGAATADDDVIIQLVGITDVSDLSVAGGVITFA